MTKNKIKLFKILNAVLTLGVCFALTKNLNLVKAKIKSSTQEEKLNEEKEIEGFELKQVVKRNNIKFLVYEHKLSGALAVVHNMERSCFSGFYFANLKKNSLTKSYGLMQMLENEIMKNFEYLKQQNRMHDYVNLAGNDGVLNLNIDFKDRKFIDFVLKELKNPSFLKEENLTQGVKNIIKMQINKRFYELKSYFNFQNIEIYKKLNERFVGGNFVEENLQKEVDNLTIEDLKEEFKNKILPQNTMVAINSAQYKNYKEILENLSNNYFNYFKKTKEHNNFKHNVEKEAFRKFEVTDLTIIDFNKKDKYIKKPKFMARLCYDVSNLTYEEKYFLAINYFEFKELMKDYLKKLGYCYVKYNEKEDFNDQDDSITFDNLIFVDLFGDDEKLFEKETLIKNFKKIIKEFVKRAKNLETEKRTSLNNIFKRLNHVQILKDYDSFEEFGFLVLYNIDNYIIESFNLTKNPFSLKYFNINQDGEIKNIVLNKEKIVTNFYEDSENFEKNFNFFLKNDPKYIDVLVVNKEQKKEDFEEKNNEFKFECYETPLEFPKNLKKEYYSTENIAEIIAKNIIFKNFFINNLLNKGLVLNINNYDFRLFLPESNKKEVEKYIFGEFKEKIKKYMPTENEFEYFKKQEIEKMYLNNDELKRYIKSRENFLNDKKRIKKLAEQNKNIVDLIIKNKKRTKGDINYFKNKQKKQIETLEKNKDNLNYFIEHLKKNNNKIIKEYKKFLENNEKNIKFIENVKFKEVLDKFKNLKFKNISNLEKEKINC